MKKLGFLCTVLSVLCMILAMSILTGCHGADSGTQHDEQQTTEKQQSIHLKSTPPPVLQTSQERKNLKERLNRFNTDSKVSYIYLIDYGKIMAFYTVKGKVSSVNSLLTTPEQIVDHRWGNGTTGNLSSHVVASPDLDGSYGSNGDAVFFFDTAGTYIEWNGKYMLCDKPLKMTTPPQLVIQSKE